MSPNTWQRFGLLILPMLALLTGSHKDATGVQVQEVFLLPEVDSLPPAPDSLLYPFLDWSKNNVGQPEALAHFFHSLDELAAGRRRQVRIAHIGDSHLQADFFSGRLRALLQERFGTGGRGLVFPYSLARTNSPVDLKCSSDQAWEYRRSVYAAQGPPLGLCGISLRTYSPGASFVLRLADFLPHGRDPGFDRVTLFFDRSEQGFTFLPAGLSLPDHPSDFQARGIAQSVPEAPQPRRHRVRQGDTLYDLGRRYGVGVAQLMRWNQLKNTRLQIGQVLTVGYSAPAAPVVPPDAPAQLAEPDSSFSFGARYLLPASTRQVQVLVQGGEGQSQGVLFGILLENSTAGGLRYDAIGVNGVTFHHYNAAEEFWRQFPILEPDLVIISLGTNESVAPAFSADGFENQVSRFLDHLAQAAPNASVLLSTAPDALRRRRYDNPALLEVRKVLIDQASRRSLAFWDLHGAMGGRGSIRKWRAAGLAGADNLHFTKEGYWLQGRLLYQALMSAYDSRN